MKNLLNNAVVELVERVSNELGSAKKEMIVLDREGDKINAVIERRENIINLFKKIDNLNLKMKEQFPDEELDIDIDRFKFIVNIQLEDLLDMAHGLLKHEDLFTLEEVDTLL